MGNRTWFILFLTVFVLAENIFAGSSCGTKTMTNGVDTVTLNPDPCLQTRDMGVAANTCKAQGKAFFRTDTGALACENQYPRGYKQICEEVFKISVNHQIVNKSGTSYRTISQEEYDKCIKGGSVSPAPSCEAANGTWKSSGGRDSFSACYCADNSFAANVTEDKCGKGNSDAKKCSDENTEVWSSSQKTCVCKLGYERDKTSMSELPECVKIADPTNPNKTPVADEPSQKMKECVAKWKTKSETCKSSAAGAKLRCSQENIDNEEVKSAMQIPGQISNAYVQANYGKGMTTECLKAGAISNSTNIALASLKKSCDENFTKCNEECGLEKSDDFYKECSQYLKDENGQPPPDDGNATSNYFTENEKIIRANYNEGTPICKGDATKNNNILNSLLSGLADTLKKGMLCACQMAASMTKQSSEGCTNLPTAAQCQANPALVGCAAFQIVDICSIGSQNYSYQGCKCQSDPKGVGCPAYAAANPNNAGFAGPDVKMPSAGGAGIGPATGTGNGTGGAEGLDLSSQKADDASAGAKPNAAGPGFLGGAGGGGAGGVGSGGGGGGSSGEPAKEADGGNGNSGGIFGQAKSFMGNLFGGGKQNAALGKATANKVDTDKFKPKGSRGVAGNSGFGAKNMDIWLMMNNRYEENQNSFILAP